MSKGIQAVKERVEAAQRGRAVHTYEVPAIIEGDVRTVGLVELTADEELMATKRSRADNVRLAYELAKQSLVEINGQQVTTADGSSDKAWTTMPPKVRNLVLQAYADLHAPPEGAIEGFLQTRQSRA